MPIKYLFALLLIFALSAGCNLMDRQSPPDVAETPPYLQPRSGAAQKQLAEMRTFHENESSRMSKEMNIIHNSEMKRLEAAGKELERDKRWQEDYKKTQERRAKWMNWFKKTDK